MKDRSSSASRWYHGLTLAERVATLRMVQPVPPPTRNLAYLVRYLHRWHTQPYPAHVPITWRTSEEGITAAELHQVLSEPVADVAHRHTTTPGWITAIIQAFTHPAPAGASPLPPIAHLTPEDGVGWLYLVEPLIQAGCTRLRTAVAQLRLSGDTLPFDPETIIPLCLPSLLTHLATLLTPTMSLELNVTRLQHRFPNPTPHVHFQSFLAHIRQPQVALALLQEYPVLARQVMFSIDQWVTTSQEFLTRLCADWSLVQTTFATGQAIGNLVRLDRDQDDQHCGGRTVLRATFANGLVLVYKPRSLAVDVHFQRLLHWLNMRGAQPPFRTLQMLDRGNYGWVEDVWAEPCASAAAAERFYRRCGGYLALLGVLGALDMDCDNVIAAGEHPVLNDLETLLQGVPTLAEPGSTRPDLRGEAGAVLPLGLLPACICAGDYPDAIVAGFTAMYQVLLVAKPALLSCDGPLASFADVPVRAIVRPNWFYDALLTESLHPDLLRSGLSRDRCFDHLWTSIPHTPRTAQVIAAERAALQRGNIPCFQTSPTTRDVWTSDGHRIVGLLGETSMRQMQHRILQLGAEALAQQIGCLRAALSSAWEGGGA